MKIFGTINNFKGTGLTEPSVFGEGEPDWYELPDSSLLRSGNPFFVPGFSDSFKAYPALAIRIGRLGKGIAAKFAHRYIDGWTAGYVIVADTMLAALRAEGKPWSRATAFDRCCPLGNLQDIGSLKDNGRIAFECGGERIDADWSSLAADPSETVALLSTENTLKTGDIILAGIYPEGFRLIPGMRLTARCATREVYLLETNIK